MNKKLNASEYIHKNQFYENEFRDILKGILVCYKDIVSTKTNIENNEEKIRDLILLNYLDDDNFKKKYFNLANYHFDRETIENRGNGRVDIRILKVNPYENPQAYFIIECKRLDDKNQEGKNGLNAKYIKNGICRFVTRKYSSYFGINGMMGFIVKKVDINDNISKINTLLDKDLIDDDKKTVNANTTQKIEPINIKCDFNYCYTSKHQINFEKEIILYHMMLDFSEIIS